MGLIFPADTIFQVSESREHPTHIGALQLFELPPGTDEHFVRRLYEDLRTYTDIRPTFRKRPDVWWTEDQPNDS